jgi:peroxiredoxin
MMMKRAEPWMKSLLWAAGLGNFFLGVLVAVAPVAIDRALGIEGWTAIVLVRMIGLMTASAGIGLMLASSDTVKSWPMTLAAMMVNVTWVWGLAAERGLSHWGWTAGAFQLVLGAGLGAVLYYAYQANLEQRRSVSAEVLKFALRSKTNVGVSLDELSRLSPVLLVFLRHAGCTFCREALADLAERRREIEGNGTRVVLVHMGSDEHGEKFFSHYGLEKAPRISDPRKNLYRAFGLPKGRIGDLIGPKVWWRGFQAGVLNRHGVGRLVGDGFQMPGVFLLFHGEIVRSYRHQSAADRPDYMQLVTGREYAAPELRS